MIRRLMLSNRIEFNRIKSDRGLYFCKVGESNQVRSRAVLLQLGQRSAWFHGAVDRSPEQVERVKVVDLAPLVMQRYVDVI
jgi:hypothetical protein